MEYIHRVLNSSDVLAWRKIFTSTIAEKFQFWYLESRNKDFISFPVFDLSGYSSCIRNYITLVDTYRFLFLEFILMFFQDFLWICICFLFRLYIGRIIYGWIFLYRLRLNYERYLISNFWRCIGYPTIIPRLFLFEISTESEVIRCFFEEKKYYASQLVLSFFSSISYYFYVENCANTHITNKRDHLLT